MRKTTYQEKLSDHYMMYVWFPSRHLKLNVHQTNFCMVWYVKFRTRRREFLHSTVSGSMNLLSFSNFQINDQFALIQFALAVQVIEWGQSMWNMCQDYYFSCFCHIFFSVFILENSWNVMQYFVNINRVQGYQMGVWELRSLIGWYGQRHIKHKHVANKNRSAEVQNTTQKRFNW